jgi:hypothetical protein
VKGWNDGLRFHPASQLLWATVNEDANSSLFTIDPATGTIKHFQFSAASHGGGYDDLAFTGGRAFIAASNPPLDSSGNNTAPASAYGRHLMRRRSRGAGTARPILES